MLIIRLIIFIVLVLFVIWIIQPFLKTKDIKKNKDTVDKLLNSDQNNFRLPNTIFITLALIILLSLIVWLLPKFGINFFSLLQKIIPLISSLRSIVPF